MNKKKQIIARHSKIVWPSNKLIQVPVPGDEKRMMWISQPVNGTYRRDIHGPIGKDANKF